MLRELKESGSEFLPTIFFPDEVVAATLLSQVAVVVLIDTGLPAEDSWCPAAETFRTPVVRESCQKQVRVFSRKSARLFRCLSPLLTAGRRKNEGEEKSAFMVLQTSVTGEHYSVTGRSTRVKLTPLQNGVLGLPFSVKDHRQREIEAFPSSATGGSARCSRAR